MSNPSEGHWIEEIDLSDEDGRISAPHLSNPEADEANITTVDSQLGQSVLFLRQRFGDPEKVLYAACGSHVIDALFPNSHIDYVDPSQNDIEIIRKKISERSKAMALEIEQFGEKEFYDAVFSLNSHAPMEEQIDRLKPNGYIFCNNYFGTKDFERALSTGKCTLRAVIDFDEDNQLVLLEREKELEVYLAIDESMDEDSILARHKKVASYYILSKNPEPIQ